MAIDATCVYEVRTDGSANNGGGYVPGSSGTDFSQQASAQYALTTATSAGAGAVISDAAAAADMVGNLLRVVSGTNFTVGDYEILSVVVGVSITVDRNCTTGAGSSGTINVGGAKSHPDDVDDTDALTAGVTIYIRGGTYTGKEWTTDSASDAGNGLPIRWIGYGSTRGDNPTRLLAGDNRPIIDGENVRGCLIAAGEGNTFENFVTTRSNDEGIRVNNNVRPVLVNVRSHTNTTYGLEDNEQTLCIGCEFDNNTLSGMRSTQSGTTTFRHCWIHDNADMGANRTSSSGHITVERSSFTGNGDTGLRASGALNIDGANVYGNTGASSDGVEFADAASARPDLNCALNTFSSGNGRYGWNQSGGTDVNVTKGWCGSFGHTTEENGTFIDIGGNLGDVDPKFTDEANDDFTLESGSPLIGVGIDPMLASYLITMQRHNIGLSQDDPDAGGGGGGGIKLAGHGGGLVG